MAFALSFRGVRTARASVTRNSALTAAEPNATLVGAVVPADGTYAATWRERRLRLAPIYGQLSDKQLLATVY
jgi:hypothetical protein